MVGRIISTRECLELIPQQEPFRYVDEISELSGDGVVAHYRWREDHAFYRGHFPGNPVTPGVLLLECMAQCSVVPLAMYLSYRDFEEAPRMTTLFTDATVDFLGVVEPGRRVTVRSRPLFYRRRKLRVRAEMHLDGGGNGGGDTLVCNGELAGLGVMA